MRKISGMILCLVWHAWAENLQVLQYTGVRVPGEGNSTYLIERKEPVACMDIAITPRTLFGDASRKVDSACTRRVFTTLGTIQPIQIDPQIQTVGELEVLRFIKASVQHPDDYLLIDARKPQWYKTGTIPTAVNIPYNEIAYDADFPEERERLLRLLHIEKGKSGYLFSHAKRILLFCNGAWCVQSVRAIRELIKLGYPKRKMLWYRGGVQDWLAMGFETVPPSESR